MKAAATLASMVLLLAACATQPSTRIGPDLVQSELVGRTWQVKLPNGAPATEYFRADGTMLISGGLNDSGRWHLSGDGYCTAWTTIRHGEERCFTVYKTADGQYRIYKPDGGISMTVVGFN